MPVGSRQSTPIAPEHLRQAEARLPQSGPDEWAGVHRAPNARRAPGKLYACCQPRIENEKPGFAALKSADNACTLVKQPRDICRRTIAEPNPNAFRRRAEKHGPLPEILILGNDREPVRGSVVPNIGIIRVR